MPIDTAGRTSFCNSSRWRDLLLRARPLPLFPASALLLVSLSWLAAPAFAATSKVTICHSPPGNPDNPQTITVGVRAVAAHLAHGDIAVPCEDDEVDCSTFDPFSIAVLPDTQNYVRDARHDILVLDLFTRQTEWIAANKEDWNFKFVLHEGDVVQSFANPLQWARARKAMDLLHGLIPFAISPGNHDGASQKVELAEFNAAFPLKSFRHLPSFGGAFEHKKMDNTYHYFRGGGVKWLVLALEFGPRDEVLDWANDVVADHADRQVIIVTHAYLYSDGRHHGALSSHRWNPHRYPVAAQRTVNDGAEMWEKLVRKHANIAFVFNGHVLNKGRATRIDVGDQGNQVYQRLSNFQSRTLGGASWLNIYEFFPRENVMETSDYSPYYNAWEHVTNAELTVFDPEYIESVCPMDVQVH